MNSLSLWAQDEAAWSERNTSLVAVSVSPATSSRPASTVGRRLNEPAMIYTSTVEADMW